MTGRPRGRDSEDLFRLPAHQLACELARGRCSARELFDHYLQRIERLNPKLNAFVYLDPMARDAAEESDRRFKARCPRGPLEGIPVAVKDNLLMRDCPAVWGSELYADYWPDHDELPVSLLREAGAVLIGKTNVPEFALRGYTDNRVFGVTRNPWDLARTPGGSSGGAVAAVAAGLVPLALATDGGGSIRRPAAHTGLVGMKPTVGRVARGLGFPELMFDCEVVGLIARTTADARMMFLCMAQRRGAAHRKSQRARILFVDRVGEAPTDPLIVACCADAVQQLSALGHSVHRGELPFEIDAPASAMQTIVAVGLSRLASQDKRFFKLASPDFLEQARAGQSVSASVYAKQIDVLFDFRARVARVFDNFDVVATPATAAQPWPVEDPYPPIIAGHPVGPRGHAVFTGWVNACGHPAVTIPVQPDKDGIPIGLQLVGALGSDISLLDIAEEFESAHPWADRWPALALDA